MQKEVSCNFPLGYVIMIIMYLLVFSHKMGQKRQVRLLQATFNIALHFISWPLYVQHQINSVVLRQTHHFQIPHWKSLTTFSRVKTHMQVTGLESIEGNLVLRFFPL